MMNKSCAICPRACHVDRSLTVGYCNSPNFARVAYFGLHQWEEPPISGRRGSGTIFFSGCNLRCVYCQNSAVSQNLIGEDVTPLQLAGIMAKLYNMGAHNINLVTPSHAASSIIAALNIYKPPIPICYNTSSYDSWQLLRALEGVVDIYLADLKYLVPSLAAQLSNAADYPNVAIAALAEMRRQLPSDTYDDCGVMQRGMIIRHLVLPGCLQNTYQCLEHIASEFGSNVCLSLMSQYTPCGDGLPAFLTHRLKPIEYKLAVSYARRLSLNNCFVQDSSSASPHYIPTFSTDILSVRDFLANSAYPF